MSPTGCKLTHRNRDSNSRMSPTGCKFTTGIDSDSRMSPQDVNSQDNSRNRFRMSPTGYLPHPVCPGSSSANILDDNNSDVEFKSISSDSDEFSPQENTPHLINQAEFNDLVRDLQLSRSKAELLGSRLQQWNLLLPDTKVTFSETEAKFTQNFSKEKVNIVIAQISGLFEAMNQNYDKTEWRLFIDSSKYSLKAVLLHNGNKKPSIPIGHAVNCKESYETMRTLINLIKYKEHKWKVCGDLKVIGMLVGLQGGYTKYCCFLCLWDSRAKQHHYVRKEWPVRNEYIRAK
ncbi:hypothetical protein EVAR_42068_1 [Eumeta japonica]|uniref:Uncharacterized protein n=1 Tax=Eumeta variegata TaxID=151549 RepID=A0A4C1XXZ9_EUMVA|nr:hypothetical protein EVAR_42068_1 [Eumeta japonica]